MRGNNVCITKTITSILVLSLMFILVLIWNSVSPPLEVQAGLHTYDGPYPPPEGTIELPLDSDSSPYPPPEPVVQPTPPAEFNIPQDGIYIVTSNGLVEEVPDVSQLYQFIIINEDGSLVSPAFPGTGLQQEDPPPADPVMDRIIDTDDRGQIYDTTIYPWTSVVRIEGHLSEIDITRCSGWMLGPSTVVTAGHCIYDRNRHIFTYGVTIIPGYNGEDPIPIPYGSCTPIIGKVFSTWINDGDIGYDYGVYELDCRVGEITGNLGFRTTPGSGIGIYEAVVGYPLDKGGETMWSGGGFITSSTDDSFYYDNDMTGGQSGGPVWVTDPNCTYCAIAINANEFPPPTMNQGARINPFAFNFFLSEQQFIAQMVYLPSVMAE